MGKFPGIFRNKGEKTYTARLTIPAQLREAIGKFAYTKSTGETDPAKAYAVRSRLVETEWQPEINAYLAGAKTPRDRQIETLASEYRQARSVSLDDASNFLLTDVLVFLVHEKQLGVLTEARSGLRQALASVPGAVETVEKITGILTATPFLTHQAGWEVWCLTEKHVSPKTMHEYRQTLDHFTKTVGKSLEALTAQDVKAWVRGLTAGGNGSATIKRKLSAVKSYWSYVTMEAEKIVDHNRPFATVKAPMKKDGEGERKRFEPSDVVTLWEAAESNGCQMLADFIRLGAYTGARRESIASLNVSNIKNEMYGLPRHFAFRGRGSKTEAGKRDVPIHSAIAPIVDRLIAGADRDGFLFPGKTDKNGFRGIELGQKFSALKTSLGFQEEDFHSLRHTVAHLFEIAECPVGFAKDYLGHKKQDMTFGTYSGRTPLVVQAEWAEKAIKY